MLNRINFLHFIKEESESSLNKLINNNNLDLKIYSGDLSEKILDKNK